MKLSIVSTMYYSRDYLYEFYHKAVEASKAICSSYELILVDDGSPDDSLEVALNLQKGDPNVVIVQLSKNFGHQKAIMTGLQHATGDYIFLIDCDLEEDPKILSILWTAFDKDSNLDVAYGVQDKRKGGWFERYSGMAFYSLLSILSPIQYPKNTLTARVMKRGYVEALKNFTETELDLWSIFVLAGFKQQPITVSKSSKGKSTYTFIKKMYRAIDVITSFSHRPLYFTFIFSIISFLISFTIIAVIAYKKFYLQIDVEGWASLIASIWLIGGMIFLILGIFGVYLSKMFLEIKKRPLSIIKNIFKDDGGK